MVSQPAPPPVHVLLRFSYRREDLGNVAFASKDAEARLLFMLGIDAPQPDGGVVGG